MVIFVFALTLNLRLALDDTFTLGSELAYGSGSGGDGIYDIEYYFQNGSCFECIGYGMGGYEHICDCVGTFTLCIPGGSKDCIESVSTTTDFNNCESTGEPR